MIFRSRFLKGGLVLMSVLLASCFGSNEVFDPIAQLNKEVASIDAFLAGTGATSVLKDDSGIRMQIYKLGKGLPARPNSVIDIDYVGMYFNPSAPNGEGAVFDEGNINENTLNVEGRLDRLIDGWQIALTRLPVGSKARLFVPSNWAYGNVQYNGIPANSTLIFDIEFNEIVISPTMINQWKTDTTAIEKYLEAKGITSYQTDSLGIRYVIQGGNQYTPHWYDKVEFGYKFYLLAEDTKVVSEAELKPTTELNGKVVDYFPPQGLSIGLSKLGEGGVGTFYVPSMYCFGPEGYRNPTTGVVLVPANSTLIIKLELKAIN